MINMKIEIDNITLRPFTPEDCNDLAHNANNPKIAQFLTDAFPSPYTLKTAEKFIENVSQNNPPNVLGIEIEGEICGGIGIHFKEDIYRKSAEMGYWLAEKHWGKGIIPKAIKAMISHGFANFDINRIYASPYGHNNQSKRVLEKAGFRHEATLQDAVFKNEQFYDLFIFSILKEDLA